MNLHKLFHPSQFFDKFSKETGGILLDILQHKGLDFLKIGTCRIIGLDKALQAITSPMPLHIETLDIPWLPEEEPHSREQNLLFLIKILGLASEFLVSVTLGQIFASAFFAASYPRLESFSIDNPGPSDTLRAFLCEHPTIRMLNLGSLPSLGPLPPKSLPRL